MKKLAAALALGCALLATSVAGATTGKAGSPAHSAAILPINWGVADDGSKYADDGGAWFYTQLKGANLTENRWTLSYDPANPTAITELPFLSRAAPKAQAAGIHVVLALYGRPATATDPVGCGVEVMVGSGRPLHPLSRSTVAAAASATRPRRDLMCGSWRARW